MNFVEGTGETSSDCKNSTLTASFVADSQLSALVSSDILGVRPTKTDIHGASLRVLFITTHFSHLPLEVLDEVTLQRHARAYLLLLVSVSLFPDKNGTYLQLAILPMLRDFDETAQYSWGSATLAHFY